MMSHAGNGERRWWEDPLAALPLGLWSGLLLINGTILSRRWSDALTVPLSAPVAWGSTLVIAAVSVTALVLWRRHRLQTIPQLRWLPEGLTILWPALWGTAISAGLSPYAWGGMTACAGLLLAATGLAGLWVNEARGDCEIASERAGVETDETPEFEERFSKSESLTQWQKRVRLDHGEAIEGSAQVQFAAGQKEAVVHLAFCPPFAAVPEIHAEDALGGDLEIRPEAVYPFGARLSVRRMATGGALAADVAFSAILTNEPDAA